MYRYVQDKTRLRIEKKKKKTRMNEEVNQRKMWI